VACDKEENTEDKIIENFSYDIGYILNQTL